MQTEDFSSHNVQYNWQYTSYLFNFHMNSNKFALGTMIAESDHVITQITEFCRGLLSCSEMLQRFHADEEQQLC